MPYVLIPEEVEGQLHAFKVMTGRGAWLIDERGTSLAASFRAGCAACSMCPSAPAPGCLDRISPDAGGWICCKKGALFLCAKLPNYDVSLVVGPWEDSEKAMLSPCAPLLKASAHYLCAWQFITERDDLFTRLTLYIRAHLNNDLSPKSLAAELFTSQATLSKAVKAETGLPVSHYVQRLRLESTINLIKCSALPITEIAGRCGMDDFNYYARIFKKWYGMSPREYRKAYRSELGKR